MDCIVPHLNTYHSYNSLPSTMGSPVGLVYGFFTKIYLFTYFMYLGVLPYVCLSEGVRSPRPAVTALPCGCWELTLGPQKISSAPRSSTISPALAHGF